MKSTDNIEQKLTALKQHYNVPEAYFEHLQIKKPLPVKTKTFWQDKKVWMAAAFILLLVSLGYKVFNWSHPKPIKPDLSSTNTLTNDDLFSDLSDEDIIDYLADEDWYDQGIQ